MIGCVLLFLQGILIDPYGKWFSSISIRKSYFLNISKKPKAICCIIILRKIYSEKLRTRMDLFRFSFFFLFIFWKIFTKCRFAWKPSYRIWLTNRANQYKLYRLQFTNSMSRFDLLNNFDDSRIGGIIVYEVYGKLYWMLMSAINLIIYCNCICCPYIKARTHAS